MTLSGDDTESGASGANAGDGASEDGRVADGVVEERSKCKGIHIILFYGQRVKCNVQIMKYDA